jgi:phosphoserine phosphatase
VLITGALDFVVAPLRPLFDDIVCARLSVSDGTVARYTGQLAEVPPAGESRAQALFDYSTAEGLDVREAVAYADSASDLPMLDAVGFPVAVNPETRLAAIARKRGWLVEHWDRARGAPAPLIPLSRKGDDEADSWLNRLVSSIGAPLVEQQAEAPRRLGARR